VADGTTGSEPVVPESVASQDARRELERLVDQGFGQAVGPNLRELARGCRIACETSGDARYCVVAQMLDGLAAWLEDHDESGGVPIELLGEIQSVVAQGLPAVLDADSSATGTAIARSLRETVLRMRSEPDEWKKGGWAKPTRWDG
jgi:hypothetical protein